MTISIILPVYNEVKSLEHVISNWSKYLIEKKLTHEFVICEDGSTDGTKELIKNLEKSYNISNQSVKNRRGYGQGVISGIIAAKYEFILCIDSDGQCMPDSFDEFLKNKNGRYFNKTTKKRSYNKNMYSNYLNIHDYLLTQKLSLAALLSNFKKDVYKNLLKIKLYA